MRPATPFCFVRLCNFSNRRLNPSDSITNLSISHRPAGPGGLSIMCMACMTCSPPRQSGRFNRTSLPDFDIGANIRFRHSAPSEPSEKKLVPRCQIADAPGIETDDAKVPTVRRGLFRKNKLDEIACLRWSSFARLGQRMTGRGHGNDLDAFNIDAAKTRHVHVQQASNADGSMAVSDHAFDAAKGLHQEANRHRRELGMEFTKQHCQPLARQHAVDHERHFRLSSSRTPNARA